MGIQILISVLITLCIFEKLWQAIIYSVYNNNGEYITFENILVSLLDALDLTLIRFLLLLVALGYSITAPVLSNIKKILIGVLVVFYFLSAASNNYINVLIDASIPVDDSLNYITVFFLAMSNTIFAIWIGYAAWVTVRLLRRIEELNKYVMYRNLSMILVGCLGVSVIFFITQFFIEATNSDDDAYRLLWIFTAYWEFIYFIIITYVAYIWIPNPNNLRYAFHHDNDIKEDVHQDDENVDLEEKSTIKKTKKEDKKEYVESSSSDKMKEEKNESEKSKSSDNKEDINLEETSKD